MAARGSDGARRGGDGQGGIRTLDTVARMPPFQGGAFNHSATCPDSLRGRNLAAHQSLGQRFGTRAAALVGRNGGGYVPHRDRRLSHCRSPHADRTCRRRAGRHPPRRPRCARHPRPGGSQPASPGPHRRRHTRLRQPGRGGQPQRRAHGPAPRRTPGRNPGSDREPPLRLRPAGSGQRCPRHPCRRRCAVPRGWSREHDPRTLHPAQDRQGVGPYAAGHGRQHGGMAVHQPGTTARLDDFPGTDGGASGAEPWDYAEGAGRLRCGEPAPGPGRTGRGRLRRRDPADRGDEERAAPHDQRPTSRPART